MREWDHTPIPFFVKVTSMREQLQRMRDAALQSIAQAAGEAALQEIRVRFLGRKGELTGLMKGLGALSAEERPVVGQLVNTIKDEIEFSLEGALTAAREQEISRRLQSERIDVTLPGRRQSCGTKHPITLVIEEVCDIFAGLGFSVAEGPEIEHDWYNFEALNFPPEHPARDMQDTFFVENNLLLRTHTSPVQIRTMLKQKPPVRIIAPGTVYRCDSDATHSPMFHQIEVTWASHGCWLSARSSSSSSHR